MNKKPSKSKAKNKKSTVKTEKISKYFQHNQVESKTCNQVLDDSLQDFKSPVAIKSHSQTSWNLNKNPTKTRKAGKKKLAKNATIEIVKENFGVNGEHMQMAIALSKSAYEAEYGHSTDKVNKTETPDLSAILQNVKPMSLEQFGFKSAKSVLPALNPKPTTVDQPIKKNRFKYITPILNIRSKEERESLIQEKISEILKSNVPPQSKIKTNYTCRSNKLQKLIPKNPRIWTEIDYFYVDSLGLEKDTCKCGDLLKDWSTIPGRDCSPVRTEQKSFQHVKVSSESRCSSPDLFESEDELDKESESSKNCNKPNMSTKVNSVDLTDSDGEDGIGSSSNTKPVSFYNLDEFELDNDVSFFSQSNRSYQMKRNTDDPKATDSTFNNFQGGFLEDEFIIEDNYLLDIKDKPKSANYNTHYESPKISNISSQDINKYQSSLTSEVHVNNMDINSDLPEIKSQFLIEDCLLDNENEIVTLDSVDYSTRNASPTDINNSSQDINKLQSSFTNEMYVNNVSFNPDLPKTRSQFIFEDHYLLDNDTETVKLDSAVSITYNASPQNINKSQNINKNKSPFANEIDFEFRPDLPEMKSPVCIEISDDSSMDSNTMTSQLFTKLERFSQNSSPKRKLNIEKVSFDDTLVNTNHYFSFNNKFHNEIVNNDLSVNYEFENNVQDAPLLNLKANDNDEGHEEFKKTASAELTFNDSLSDIMESYKSDFSTKMNESSVAKKCADDVSPVFNNESSLVSKISKELNIIKSDSKNSVAPKISRELCIEISDEGSTDENNVNFQSNSDPTTPKINFSTASGPNKKSLNINSAELNITDYVQQMLNKDHYTFDDVELKLSQESQSSHIDDEELNYSCHFNTPLKSLKNQVEVTSKQKSPSLSSQVREEPTTPENYIIKTRNVTPMPDFDSLTTPAIHRELEKVGVKALKRARGAQLLKYIYESTHPLVGSEDLPTSDDEEKVIKRRKRRHTNDIIGDYRDTRIEIEGLGRIEILGDRLLKQEKPEDLIFERRPTKIPSCSVPLQIVWHNFVSLNPSIKESILLYQPLNLELLHSMLKELGYKYHIQDLLSFLDKKCITIRTTQGKRPNK